MGPVCGAGGPAGDGVLPVKGIGIDADGAGNADNHQEIVEDHPFYNKAVQDI